MTDTEERYYGYVDPEGNRITLDSQFSVIVGFETSPSRIDEEAGVEGALKPQRVDLREIPMGSVVQFYGMHPDSRYICLLSGAEEDRKIKVWLKGRGNGAVGSIDSIISYSIRTWPNVAEKGVLEIGKNYFMPTFRYHEEGALPQPMFDIKTYDPFYDLSSPRKKSGRDLLSLDSQITRTEPYTKLFVLTPDHPRYGELLKNERK